MRAAVFGLLLAACSGHGKPSSADIDAAPPLPLDSSPEFVLCEAPTGTATITAAHQDLEPQYARMYAGGIFTGEGDSGGPPGFDVGAYFTNEALTTATAVRDCEASATCAGFVVEVLFLRGDELGAHSAQIRNTASTWQATGTVTLTDFVYPENVVGHVAGSIHVDSTDPQVTIDGSFDHTFCLGLLGAVL